MINHTTILIIEDEPSLLNLLVRVVQTMTPSSYILTAADGEEGLRKARQSQPDLIITDLAMPKINGYQLVRCLRQEITGKPVLIIGIDGDDPTNGYTGPFRELCDRFLIKPFMPSQLAQTITLLEQFKG